MQVQTSLVAQSTRRTAGRPASISRRARTTAGSYHQPAACCATPRRDTLPEAEAAAGYAEVVKTALIAGGALWARVRQGQPPGAREIMGCVRTKLGVVREDERDGGRRQVLNLGHTVGHAIEAATGYGRYRHGEAVGIGLLAALRLSEREALRAEVSELLAARGLPLSFSGADVDEVVRWSRAKKARSGACLRARGARRVPLPRDRERAAGEAVGSARMVIRRSPSARVNPTCSDDAPPSTTAG